MCAIAGLVSYKNITQADSNKIRNLIHAMGHRGPDGIGFWSDESFRVHLGHARLSIIDINSRSAQPFKIGNYTISFNGEIYNYKNLKSRLESLGHIFYTDSDTEVLLISWIEWGEKCLELIDGMYAFAIYDGYVLHLVTDPFGEKPLFIYDGHADQIWFASELSALSTVLDLKPSLSDCDIFDFLSLGYLPSEHTGFKNVESLGQASHYKIYPNGNVEKSRYWTAPEIEIKKGKVYDFSTSDIKKIEDAIANSLELRLNADVSLGMFLSSGVDSTLIAAMCSRVLNKDLLAFTVAYQGNRDESAVASLIASDLNLRHIIVDGQSDVLAEGDIVSRLGEKYACPNDNSTLLSVMQMSLIATKYMKVALVGSGGDEIFYGYNKYQFMYKNRLALKYGRAFFSRSQRLKSLFNKNTAIYKYLDILNGDRYHQFLSIKNHGLGEFFNTIRPRKYDSWFDDNKFDLVYHARRFDMAQTLQKSYIPAIELGSMNAGLEVRSPFLSRRLLETISSYDQRSFLEFGQKHVQKRILERYLDKKILLKIQKKGFIYPVEEKIKAPNFQNHSGEKNKIESLFAIYNEYKQNDLARILLLRLLILERFYAQTD